MTMLDVILGGAVALLLVIGSLQGAIWFFQAAGLLP
jgi:hypothetical protein